MYKQLIADSRANELTVCMMFSLSYRLFSADYNAKKNKKKIHIAIRFTDFKGISLCLNRC